MESAEQELSASRNASKIAVITGGAGALAGALRSELELTGWQVLAPGRRELDVCRRHSVERYFQNLERLDLLINNAGVRIDRAMAAMSETDWDHVVDTSLKGAFLCSQAAARLMIPRGDGCMVNVGSYSGRTGVAGQANYAAAKAGLVGLTQSLAREFGPAGIRVNCVLPGWLETKFTANLPQKTVVSARSAHVLGRFNSIAESARAIVSLACLAGISGQVLQLDSRIARGG
ncbi:MAG: SDR family oxidoreductase [Verrucomicrobiales bacterium]|nr:SDR family oxidoreductase [Verrucomicrobiales bacterium]